MLILDKVEYKLLHQKYECGLMALFSFTKKNNVMFKKILIANRGEIALRIIGTCRRMGIGTVAVFSEADSDALHVKEADEECFIGEAAPTKSYLIIDKILDTAKEKGCEAIHPGYGFLSENAQFARRCSGSGITFIGPSAEAIELMGEKDRAKDVMLKAGVPVIPGYYGEEQSKQFLLKEADKIGYPLMVKAVFGGGGKGMRVVQKKEEFEFALTSVENEATKAFGKSRVMLESFIKKSRHIEFQVLGDQYGNIVHLFERDCSVQRRHQKIVEESPSLFIDNQLRDKIADAAVIAAKSVKYTGAGTVEFIIGDDNRFYFMEMNTRLQVEHPITEMITGIDLVECQLQIAAGGKLNLKQSKINKSGHAIEARIYAENPAGGFLPSTGELHKLAIPEAGKSVKNLTYGFNNLSPPILRIDTGVKEGDQISIDYDPLIAKLIVHADTRKNTIIAMLKALSETAVIGVDTNLGFLQSIFLDGDFKESQQDTLFIESNLDSLLEQEKYSAEWVCWTVAVYCFIEDSANAEKNALNSSDPSSPWNSKSSWRALRYDPYRVHLRNHKGELSEIRIVVKGDSFYILNSNKQIYVTVSQTGSLLELKWSEGDEYGFGEKLLVLHHESQLVAVHKNGREFFRRVDTLQFEKQEENQELRLFAPMPGNVIRILVTAGERVSQGQQLLVIEAMKMEHAILAPTDGFVVKVLFKQGDLVQNGSELIEFTQLKNDGIII